MQQQISDAPQEDVRFSGLESLEDTTKLSQL